MFAKQTVLSASLVAWFGAASIAHAQPADGEVSHQSYFAVGAGFSSDESFIASAEAVAPDLFHTGLYLGLFARISATHQRMLLRFADPHLLGSDLSLSTDLYDDMRVMPGFTRKAIGFAPTLSMPLSTHWRAFVGYRLEQIAASSDIATRGGDLGPPLQSGRLSALRAGVEYTTPRTRIGTSFEVANRDLGSQIDMNTTKVWASTHQPIGPLTLHLRGSATALSGNVPLNERLFLDSSTEVRGYRMFSLGPVDSLGRPIGGELKAVGSAELEVPLVRRIGLSAVGFVDAGAIYDRTGRGEVGRSAGVGLLWHSPIGPLELDVAFPLSGGKPAFVFGIGGVF